MAGPLARRTASTAELPQAIAGSETALIASRRRVVDALRLAGSVRGPVARVAALRQLSAALRMHEAALDTAMSDGVPAASSQVLYRHVAPDTVLANVIARELAAAPDRSGWTARFAELEAAVQARIA